MTSSVRPLTPREGEILRLLAEGLTRSQMARRLGVALSTLRAGIASLYEALGVVTAAHAVSRGYELGLMRPASGVCCRRAVADWLDAAASRVAAEIEGGDTDA